MDFSSISGISSIASKLSALSDLRSAIQDLLAETNRPIRLQLGAEDSGSSMVVHSFQASESTNAASPLRLRILCLAARQGLSPSAFLGKPVRLQLVTDTGELRSFCGIVRHAQSAPDDGSGAQPWLLEAVDTMSLMDQGRNSRIFLNSSVMDIATVILREWTRTLGNTFDFDTSNLQLDRYQARGMSIQWNESDTAFLQRLLRKHGISWAVKPADGDTPAHTLVLFDDSHRLPRNAAGTLRYHVDSAMQSADMITVWSPAGRITPGNVAGQSWDYKTQRTGEHMTLSQIDFGEHGNAVADSLLEAHTDTPHWAEDGDEYQRMGEQRMQYHEMQAALVQGASSARDATVMTRFTAQDRPGIGLNLRSSGAYDDQGDEFIFLQVEHWGQNNLPKDLAAWMETVFSINGWHMQRPNIGHYHEKRRYANTFLALPRSMPIVPSFDPEMDWPKLPPMVGVVVCPPGEEVHCDEYGRVFVQIQGLRVEDHDHAGGAGVSGTPSDSAPIRVAMPAASPGHGMLQLPRSRDEVLITFIGGDPDKPIITHSIHSPVNAPTSFHGVSTLPGNRYMSGNRSQEIGGAQATHVLHDNTPKQTSMQAHADHAHSQLTLGFLTTPRVDGEATPRGEGAELRTDASAALRAAQGLLISAWSRLQATGNHLDVQEALGVMQTGMDLFKCMGEYAAKHQGFALKPEQQQDLAKTMQHWQDGSNTSPDKQAIQTGIVTVTAPEGIAHATAKSMTSTAGSNIDTVAMQNMQHVAGEQILMQAGKGMSLFAHDGGLQLVGHKGPVQVQSQSDTTSIEAAQDIDIVAKGNIRIVAKQIELIAQDGSFVQIGGGITLGTNDAILQHAGSFTLDGPKMRSGPTPAFSVAPANVPKQYSQRLNVAALIGKDNTDKVWKRLGYDAIDSAGKHIAQGVIDGHGSTGHIYTEAAEKIKIAFQVNDNWLAHWDADHGDGAPAASDEDNNDSDAQ